MGAVIDSSAQLGEGHGTSAFLERNWQGWRYLHLT
jgi:hypothetical protein